VPDRTLLVATRTDVLLTPLKGWEDLESPALGLSGAPAPHDSGSPPPGPPGQPAAPHGLGDPIDAMAPVRPKEPLA
jgi:hypothetical protein